MAATSVDAIHDSDAERAVLGAAILDRTAQETATSALKPGDFFDPRHQTIFANVEMLAKKGEPADPVTLRSHLQSRAELVAAGGGVYLSELIDAVPDVANAAHYARLIKEAATRRRLAKIGADLHHRAAEETVKSLIESTERRLREVTGTVTVASRPSVRTLGELRADPRLLAPPEALIPGLAWRGRVTLLAAREKLGKSTTLQWASAVLSRGGDLLGQTVQPGAVLWWGVEEALSDVVRRFDGFGAVDGLLIADNPVNEITWLRAAVEQHRPDVVVIDSLAAWGSGRVTDWKDSAQVTPVMIELVAVARDLNVALVLIHHGKKADGSYRDSTAIGANVDVLIEMAPDEKDDSVRHLKAKGRWTVEPLSIRWTGRGFELASGALSTRDRILALIRANPGIGTKGILRRVTGSDSIVKAELDRLETDRLVENKGDSTGAAWYLPVDVIGLEVEKPRQHPGNGSGNASTPDPEDPGKANGQLSGNGGQHPPATVQGSPVAATLMGGGGQRSEEPEPGIRLRASGLDEHLGEPGLPAAVDSWPRDAKRRLRDLRAGSWQKDAAIARVRETYGGVTCSRGGGPLDRPPCDEGSSVR